MQDFHRQFVELAVARGVLCFGEYRLKSGRVSPYFFNAGLFDSGAALAQLGRFYAQAIVSAGLEFDMLFGPAYKGIPLVAATAVALAEQHGRDLPWCFNRKEAKAHGEGGDTVGAALGGRVLLIDDVITAGTAIGEAARIIAAHGAVLAGVVIALDRRESGSGERSAVAQVAQTHGVPVVSIATLDDVLDWLEGRPELAATRSAVEAYRARYGAGRR